MPYPFSWQPSYIFTTTPSQVSVFDSSGNLATLSVGIAVSMGGVITFTLQNFGTYTVKVRYNMEIETAKFTTASSGTSAAQYVSYEQINLAGINSLANYVSLAQLNDPDSDVNFILANIISSSSSALPAGGTANQVVRKNSGNTGTEWTTLTKSNVGLGNVDNTADADKPVSTAQQTALNAKANSASPTFTGTPTGLTKAHVGLGNVDNTADSAKPVSTAQQTALDAKANSASPAFTGTPTGLTKAHVGLGSVDNTADSAKPVSTAQSTAIGLKRGLVQAITTRTTTPYSVAVADEIIFANMATAITITLLDPATANITGREYTIKNIGAGTLTVNSAGTSKTIDGAATQTLAQYAKMKVVSNGTNWFIVG